jgi:hypothetical protein
VHPNPHNCAHVHSRPSPLRKPAAKGTPYPKPPHRKVRLTGQNMQQQLARGQTHLAQYQLAAGAPALYKTEHTSVVPLPPAAGAMSGSPRQKARQLRGVGGSSRADELARGNEVRLPSSPIVGGAGGVRGDGSGSGSRSGAASQAREGRVRVMRAYGDLKREMKKKKLNGGRGGGGGGGAGAGGGMTNIWYQVGIAAAAAAGVGLHGWAPSTTKGPGIHSVDLPGIAGAGGRGSADSAVEAYRE